ncbi:MAG: DUF1499 domain-containing protein [Desulfobulbaceae bacterium]|nr:DUF1499 domain-containing protein [Desulfobulbaceae bacterium]
MMGNLVIKALIFISILGGCTGKGPHASDVPGAEIAGCPDKPNCVSSEAKTEKHHIEPFYVKGDISKNWLQIQKLVEACPRTKIITQTDVYLHAESRSLIFRFVDDLELLLNPASGVVAVRSASRKGYSDFGVNRRRVEELREKLFNAGVIH